MTVFPAGNEVEGRGYDGDTEQTQPLALLAPPSPAGHPDRLILELRAQVAEKVLTIDIQAGEITRLSRQAAQDQQRLAELEEMIAQGLKVLDDTRAKANADVRLVQNQLACERETNKKLVAERTADLQIIEIAQTRNAEHERRIRALTTQAADLKKQLAVRQREENALSHQLTTLRRESMADKEKISKLEKLTKTQEGDLKDLGGRLTQARRAGNAYCRAIDQARLALEQ